MFSFLGIRDFLIQKKQRYTAFALKEPKEFPHIPEVMEKVVRRRVLDRETAIF